jgi:hypothetical protein
MGGTGTPLWIAAELNHKEVVEQLLKVGYGGSVFVLVL